MDYVLNQSLIIVDVMDNCRCNPIQEPFEFPVGNNILSFSKIILEKECEENIDELKEKAICDFLHIIKKLECGIQPNLEFLLQEISLIYIYEWNNNII